MAAKKEKVHPNEPFAEKKKLGGLGSGAQWAGAPNCPILEKNLAVIIAIVVDNNVAKRVVGKIPAGSSEPAAARSAIIPVGNKVTLEVFMARKSIIEFVAIPLLGFKVSSSCIARIPKGVAAFPNPNAFAERFIIIAPIAG